jgi:cyclic-di-AMP phosphodiesterase PgpH
MQLEKAYRLSRELLAAVRRKIKTDLFHKSNAAFFISTALVSAVLGFLLSGHSLVRIPQYSEGDIAKADVLAPADILIMDDQATKARKASARDTTPPLYRYASSNQIGFISRLSGAFSVCRQILESSPANKAGIPFHKLSRTVQASIKAETELISPQIDEELLNFFIQKRFDRDAEDQLISALKRTNALPIVEDNRSLIGASGIIETVANSGAEKQLIPLQQVLDLERGRQKMREFMDDSFKAPAPIRRMASEWLGGSLKANLKFDLQATEARKAEAAEAVDPVLRQIKRGKIIVRQGDEVSEDQLKQIQAVRNFAPDLRSVPQFVGTNLLLFVLLTILGLLLRSLSTRQWSKAKLTALFFMTLVANVGLLRILWFISDSLSRNFVVNPFNDSKLFFAALPFAFGSMLITLLAGDRFAQLFLVFYCPLAAQIAGAGFQDFLFIVAINLIGILAAQNVRHRMAIVGAGFKISAAAAGLFIAVQFAKRIPLNLEIGAFGAAMAFLSGPITASLLTFTLPLCEHLFLVTTEIRLSELGNLNLPLLRELVVRAPGTYNHSIAVGTLAQGAANAIGLNALFLRVASLYHDIGKYQQPQYFIENQGKGDNPHDSLDPLESVRLIRQHVTDGIRLGHEAGLPPAIIDVIPQHHGTKLLSYFYDKAKKQAGVNNSTIRDEDYRHLGPKPQTKEAAVIMLADSIEAAARTLSDHSQERLLAVIKKITAVTIEDGQFAECDLTLSEIERITFSFLETLASFYHSRIDYPSFDFSAKPGLRAET